MKIKILFITVLLSISSLLSANEAMIDNDIASCKTIDELILKMNQTKQQYRYKYMNAIKQQLSSLQSQNRQNEINTVFEKIQNSKSNDGKSSGKNEGNGNGGGSRSGGGNGKR